MVPQGYLRPPFLGQFCPVSLACQRQYSSLYLSTHRDLSWNGDFEKNFMSILILGDTTTLNMPLKAMKDLSFDKFLGPSETLRHSSVLPHSALTHLYSR